MLQQLQKVEVKRSLHRFRCYVGDGFRSKMEENTCIIRKAINAKYLALTSKALIRLKRLSYFTTHYAFVYRQISIRVLSLFLSSLLLPRPLA